MSSRTKEEAEEVTDIFDEKIVDIMVMHVPITATFNYFKIRPHNVVKITTFVYIENL